MDAVKKRRVEKMAQEDAKSGSYTTDASTAAALRSQGDTYKKAFEEERGKIRRIRRRREEE